MVVRSPILEGLVGRQKAAVLSVLLARPEARLYQRQIAEMSGLRLVQAQRALRALADSGVLQSEHEGNRVYYSPNPSSPILRDLTAIVLKTAGVVDVLRVALVDVQGIALALVYGSVARQEQTAGSDVDLLLVGEVAFEQLSERLHRAEETLGREVNLSVYPETEFWTKAADRHYFVMSVIEGPKLFVIGDADVLRRLAEAALAE